MLQGLDSVRWRGGRLRRRGPVAGGDAAGSLTPELVNQLPGPVHDAIATSYNDGLTPVFLLLIPLVLVAMALMFPVEQVKLKETVE